MTWLTSRHLMTASTDVTDTEALIRICLIWCRLATLFILIFCNSAAVCLQCCWTAPNSQLPTPNLLVIQCNVDFSNNDLKTVWPGEMSDVGYRFIIGLLYFYYCHFLTFQPGQVCILNWQCLFWLRMVLLEYSLSLSLSTQVSCRKRSKRILINCKYFQFLFQFALWTGN